MCIDLSVCLSVCQVHWYHNDRLLRPSRRHEMKLTRDGVCSLRISDVTPDDAGTSVCLSVSLSVCLFVSLSVSVVCLSVSLPVCVCLSVFVTAGLYLCTATNAVGQSSNQAHLDVEPAEQPVDESSYVSPETLRRLMIRYVTASDIIIIIISSSSSSSSIVSVIS